MIRSVHVRRLLANLMTPKDWIATFVAILALTTSVWSGIAARKHDELSARPHLVITDKFASSSTRIGLELYNLGPDIGIVDDFRLALDGTPLSGDWVEQWQRFRKETGSEGWTNIGGFDKGSVLAANSSAPADILFIIDERHFSPQNENQWRQQIGRLIEVTKHLTITVKYHSVYGEHFEIEHQALKASRFRRSNWFGVYVPWQP